MRASRVRHLGAEPRMLGARVERGELALQRVELQLARQRDPRVDKLGEALRGVDRGREEEAVPVTVWRASYSFGE